MIKQKKYHFTSLSRILHLHYIAFGIPPPPTSSAAELPQLSYLRTPICPITQTDIPPLITRPIPLTTSIRLMLRLYLTVTRRPSRREEARTNIIV
jgi:hypothetical protein